MNSLVKAYANQYSKSALEEIAENADLQGRILRTEAGLPTKNPELWAIADDFSQLARYARRIIELQE